MLYLYYLIISTKLSTIMSTITSIITFTRMSIIILTIISTIISNIQHKIYLLISIQTRDLSTGLPNGLPKTQWVNPVPGWVENLTSKPTQQVGWVGYPLGSTQPIVRSKFAYCSLSMRYQHFSSVYGPLQWLYYCFSILEQSYYSFLQLLLQPFRQIRLNGQVRSILTGPIPVTGHAILFQHQLRMLSLKPGYPITP